MASSLDAMAEHPPKKRKLDHHWFVTQINDLGLSEEQKQNVGSVLQTVPENVLGRSSAEDVLFYLQDFSEDAVLKRVVAGTIHQRMRELQPSEPAP